MAHTESNLFGLNTGEAVQPREREREGHTHDLTISSLKSKRGWCQGTCGLDTLVEHFHTL